MGDGAWLPAKVGSCERTFSSRWRCESPAAFSRKALSSCSGWMLPCRARLSTVQTPMGSSSSPHLITLPTAAVEPCSGCGAVAAPDERQRGGRLRSHRRLI